MDQTDQHPIPRQITTFEFKLIGFMTLKQFLYLLVFLPSGFLVYSLLPIPILNILLGILVAGLGFALAFLPVHDRPLDVWLKNLFKILTSPTQYTYKKSNKPLYFFENLFFTSDPHKTLSHVESNDKLKKYMESKPTATPLPPQMREEQVKQALDKIVPEGVVPTTPAPVSTPTIIAQKEPVIAGVVHNKKKTPLPGILIYIKDQQQHPVRLLKTNTAGIFATYSKLEPGQYTFELKDPRGRAFFDTMNIRVDGNHPEQLEFYSKELL